MNASVVLDELQTYFRDGRYQFTLLPSALRVSGVYSSYKYVPVGEHASSEPPHGLALTLFLLDEEGAGGRVRRTMPLPTVNWSPC